MTEAPQVPQPGPSFTIQRRDGSEHHPPPHGAAVFALQRRDEKTLKYGQVEKGKWFSVEVDPMDVAEGIGPGLYRAHYRDERKMRVIGNGESFWIEEEGPDNVADEKSSRAPAPQPVPAQPRPAPPPPLPGAFAAPPLPPGASSELATHMFLYQLCRQDGETLKQQMMMMHQQALVAERARADHAIESARAHYAAMQAAADRTSAVMLQLQTDQAPGVPPELVEALSNQTTALATIDRRIEAMEQADDQHDQMAQLVEQLQGAAGAGEEPNAFATMLQNFVPLAVKAYQTYQQGQEGGAGAPAPAGDVVDTTIDPVDSAAE